LNGLLRLQVAGNGAASVISTIEMHCGFAPHSLTLHNYMRSLLSLVDASLAQCAEEIRVMNDGDVMDRLFAALGLAGRGAASTSDASYGRQRELVGTANWRAIEENPDTRRRAVCALEVRGDGRVVWSACRL
jgi:hypothetical protein